MCIIQVNLSLKHRPSQHQDHTSRYEYHTDRTQHCTALRCQAAVLINAVIQLFQMAVHLEPRATNDKLLIHLTELFFVRAANQLTVTCLGK